MTAPWAHTQDGAPDADARAQALVVGAQKREEEEEEEEEWVQGENIDNSFSLPISGQWNGCQILKETWAGRV